MINLKKNDIIVILIIFVIFTIFTFYNINGQYEHYTSLDPNDPTVQSSSDPLEQKKQEKKQLMLNIVNLIYCYVKKLNKINLRNKEIIQILFDNDYDPIKIFIGNDRSGIQGKLSNLFNIMNNNSLNSNCKSIITSPNTTNSQNFKDLENLNNELKNIHNENLFKSYNDLFTKSNIDSIYITICKNKKIEPSSEILNFLNNIQSKVDVIKSTVPLSINLISQNLNNLKSEITTLNFEKNIEKLITQIIDDYLRLIENIFNNKINFDITSLINTLLVCDKTQLTNIKAKHSSYSQHLNYISFLIKDIDTTFKKTLTELNNTISDIFIQEDELNFFKISKSNMEIEKKFCDKLKKLDKPNKNNLVFKRFSEEIIDKKKKYITDLQNKVENIYSSMTDREINDYNVNRLRIDDQASKQYSAIKKGIENIKNRNKIKINLY